MELLQLKYFQTIARTEHISNAALELHVAQPSLSQMLKRLENEVKTPLFDRVGKRIILNQSGRIFLKYVDDIFASLDNASLELNAYLNTADKTVSLCIQSASMLLPNLFKEIKQADSSIGLQIFQQQSNEYLDSGDLLISSSSQKPYKTNELILLEESIVIIIPKSYPLAHKPIITFEDLKKETFLSLNPESNLSRTLDYYFRERDFIPTINTYVDSPGMMRDLLRLDQGVAFIPDLTWRNFASDTVVTREINDFPMKRYIILSWNDKKYMTSSVHHCKQIIIDYFTRYSSQFQS